MAMHRGSGVDLDNHTLTTRREDDTIGPIYPHHASLSNGHIMSNQVFGSVMDLGMGGGGGGGGVEQGVAGEMVSPLRECRDILSSYSLASSVPSKGWGLALEGDV